MANLALVTAGRIEVNESRDQQTKVAATDIDAGQAVYENSDGKWAIADSGAAATSTNVQVYVALKAVKAGQSLTAIRDGELAGFVLDGHAPGSKVYLGLAGALADAAGVNSVVIGRVTSAPHTNGVDRVLKVLTPA